MKVCRIYERVSTDEQDLTRQQVLEEQARATGYYVAGVYREKASGATAERPELQRMIADLQRDEVVIAEKIDRLSRLPLEDAEKLVATIKAKGAKLSIPGIVDLSDIAATGTAKIVLDAMQELLLKLALQAARDDYEDRRKRQREGIEIAKKTPGKYVGRKADTDIHDRIVALRKAGHTIAKTAKLAGCSIAQVKRIWAQRAVSNNLESTKNPS
jgi:DNA invertase Pin-like site-specific DNA recombinase